MTKDTLDKIFIEKLGWFGLAYVVLWVVAARFTHIGFDLDVLEGLVWGREWLLGTHKHPPLPSWVLESAWQAGERFGVFAILPIFQVLTLWVIYLFSRQFVGKEKALLGTLLVAICFAWRSFDNVLNHNTAQVLFWISVIYLFHLAIGQKEKRLYPWLLLACAAALCFWAKYSAVFLLVLVPLWLLAHKESRAHLKTAAPWLGLLLFLLLLSPHIYFLWEHDFLPLRYALARGGDGRSLLFFLVAQVSTQLPLVFVLGLTGFIGKGLISFSRPLSTDDKFILYFAFMPLVLFVISLSVSGQNFITQWGYSFFPLMGLVAMKFLSGRFNDRRFKRAFYAAFFLMAATPIAHAAHLLVYHHTSFVPLRVLFPQPDLSQEVESRFIKATGEKPKLLVGSLNIAARVAVEMKPRPQVLLSGNFQTSYWVDKKTACDKTALVWEDKHWTKNYDALLALCSVKKNNIIKFQVPFPTYKDKTLNVNMIIISR